PQTACANPPQPASLIKGSVVRVVDGDTIRVRLANGRTERVRLIGMDTPEVYESEKLERDVRESGRSRAEIQALGRLASDFTRKRLDGGSVGLELDIQARDRYGRLLAYVSHERINDPGIQFGSGSIFYHLYSFLYLPGFPIWSSANDGIEDVRNRHDATRERDRLALKSHRISSSIPPLMVSQSNLLGQSQEIGLSL